jgi:hypothetical protein
MTPEEAARLRVVGEVAYASAAADGGIALYGTADSLMQLARIIRTGGTVPLPAPPAEIVETKALRAVQVVPGDGPVELRLDAETIVVGGSNEARAKLAASVENLAGDDPFGGVVARHIDVEYYRGHGFLSERSAWMTVTLLVVPAP